MKKPTFYIIYAVIIVLLWFAISTILVLIFDTKIPTLVMYIVYGGFIATFKPIYRWLKAKMADSDTKAASSLNMSVENFRKYRKIYQEQMNCHRMGKTPPDYSEAIPNMNEWRRYCNYVEASEHVSISQMYEKYKEKEEEEPLSSKVKTYLAIQIIMYIFMFIGIFATVRYIYSVYSDKLDDYVYLEEDIDVIHTDRHCKEIHNGVSFLDSDINFHADELFCPECVTPKQYRKLVGED